MQAIGSRDSLVLPCDNATVNKEIERHRNRLHYRAQLARLCDSLAAADLTATTYRVILDSLARMIRQGRCTEAVGNEWIAERLSVGRNAVSNAYGALEDAGFLRRIAVKHRGAPTRTHLVGVCASLIDGGIPAELHAVKPAGQAVAPARQLDVNPRHPDACLVEEGNAEPARVEAAPAAPAQEQESEPAPAPGDTGSTTPVQTKPFVYSHATFTAMVAKVPDEAREAARLARSHQDVPVDPAWCLTIDETRHYLALIPKAEAPVRKRIAPAPASQREAMPHDAELMRALAYAHPRLADITGSAEAAAKLGDQIAFQVCQGLGGGDIMGGVRAGISLVAKGRWSEPRQYSWFKAKWSGITARAVIMAVLD